MYTIGESPVTRFVINLRVCFDVMINRQGLYTKISFFCNLEFLKVTSTVKSMHKLDFSFTNIDANEIRICICTELKLAFHLRQVSSAIRD